MQNVVNNKFKILSKLYTKKCPRKFWNAIRKLKQTKSENPSKHDAISLKDFEKYFTDKFILTNFKAVQLERVISRISSGKI